MYGHPFDFDDADKDGDYEHGLASITAGLDPVNYGELVGRRSDRLRTG